MSKYAQSQGNGVLMMKEISYKLTDKISDLVIISVELCIIGTTDSWSKDVYKK